MSWRVVVLVVCVVAGSARAETSVDNDGVSDDTVQVEAGVAGGALIGGAVGLASGMATAIAWSANTPQPEILDGRSGAMTVAGGALLGVFVGGVVGGVVVGDPLSGVAGAAGATVTTMLPVAVAGTLVARLGPPDPLLYVVVPIGMVLAPFALAGVGAFTVGGALAGVCATSDCGALHELRNSNDERRFTAFVSSGCSWLGAGSGCLLSGIWLVNGPPGRASFIPEKGSPPSQWAALSLPVAGAVVGGAVGGVVAGDPIAGVVAGTGGAIGALTSVGIYAATQQVTLTPPADEVALAAFGLSAPLTLSVLAATPWMGAVALMCITGTGPCTLDTSAAAHAASSPE